MQFGRIHGIALAILGIVLLGVQTAYYMMPTNVISGPTGVSQTAHHAVNPLIWNSRPDFAACGRGDSRNREPPR